MSGSVILVILWLSAALHTEALGLLVPAYFDPGSNATNWNSLAAAAQRVPLVAIMNPNNGPSTSAKASYARAITNVQAAGGQVIGYIYSSYTRRPLIELETDIDRYLSFYKIDGFFVDEMTNDSVAAHLSYYEELYRYIKSKNPSYRVMGNPGINTLSIYMERPVADALVTFESNAGYPSYRPDVWTQTPPVGRFAHLLYAVSTAETMTNYVQLARQRNAGYVYVTDDGGTNPWDTLPGYWEKEISLIEQSNLQAARENPPFLSIARQPGSPELTLSGAPGRYVIAGSTNLEDWKPLTTNLTASGTFSIPAPARTNSHQNYRGQQ